MNWSIYIEKLFEQYDVKVEMGQRLNIIIGENGIGKSTVLKIIYAVFKRDFIELSKYTFTKMIIQTEKGTLEIKCEDMFLDGNDLEEIYLRMNRLEVPSNAILANSVEMIPFMDAEIIEPYYYAPELKWIYSQGIDYFGYFSEKYSNNAEAFNALLKKNYESINFDENFEISSGQRLFRELENQSQININKIINIASFSKEFIREINAIAAKDALELFEENNPQSIELDRSFFNGKVIHDIENYLVPLILCDTIFGKFMTQVISNENNGWLTFEYPQKLMEIFVQFYTNNIEDVFAACNSKIQVFEELLNSFSTNKTHKIYPSGIKIYAFNEHKLKMSNEINPIKLTELSSGEKKLMLILLESLFLENGLLLIDEPERSFTIMWQEKLLPTILERTGIENVIVATHSPFIASRDDMRKFLVPLPMEV